MALAAKHQEGSDWFQDRSRYGRRPFLGERSIYAVAVLRFGQWVDDQSAMRRALLNPIYLILYRAILVLTNVEIPKEATIGPGLRIYHGGPVVVHPDVVIGSGCTMRHGITLGERVPRGGVPVLGDDVDLGAGCMVLGPIAVGSGARIGAAALVIKDIPAGGVAFAPAATLKD